MEVSMALVPIAEALPELRAERFAKVREWDAARMALEGEYEAADGEYLKLIRDALKIAGHGLWTAYLRARGIADSTAGDRIRKAEGRFVASPRVKLPVTGSLHNPAPAPAWIPAASVTITPHEPEEWLSRTLDDDLPDDGSDAPALAPTPITRAAPAMFTSKSDRWFTPPDLLAKIDAFLGGIELDPCPATGEGEDIERDGLVIPWHGRVFCNPPYNRAVAAWIAKALDEPGITEAVFLVAARTDTDWWQAAVRDWTDAVCFIDGRLRFSGSANSAPFPSALLYHGPHTDQFRTAFQHLGWTIVRGGPWVSPERQTHEDEEDDAEEAG